MTSPESKVEILADLWINYKTDEVFEDFIKYNDIGLPLSYFIQTDLVKANDTAYMYVDETFILLCAALEIDPEGEYSSLNQMFEIAENR